MTSTPGLLSRVTTLLQVGDEGLELRGVLSSLSLVSGLLSESLTSGGIRVFLPANMLVGVVYDVHVSRLIS